ncbi:hypothetical protein HBA54_03885 [Pelagibius litoralis]|uniref:Surface antigen domain-containing protein n=1 Tax=Pelagibius litoralis TaxID=374515 RepID=A0A967C6Z1_9PROT|nr:RT0821/Lpp0805 family surface protein [Pelagibius litoralis]NIA67722.1 hypothetical protein [Pelagibius litoralis]
MSRKEIDDSLQAYVDGELDPAAARDVEQRLASDMAAQAQVKSLRDAAALLRSAMQGPVNEDPPQHLIDTIDRGFAARRPTPRAKRWSPALAAALAMAVVAGVAGYLAGEYRVHSTLESLAARQAEDQRLLSDAVARALEETASGNKLAWRNPDSGTYGEVTPVRTYRSKSNHWCREYLAVKVAVDSEETTRAIACREADGNWTLAEELFYDS